VYHESYGEISPAEHRAIKKHNVSPMDHQVLVDKFGEDNHEIITRYIIANSTKSGGYRDPSLLVGDPFMPTGFWN